MFDSDFLSISTHIIYKIVYQINSYFKIQLTAQKV